MGTYTYEKVISDYVNGRMPVEMAMGHNLQHIGSLYEAQTTANLSQYELRGTINTLEKRVNALQKEVARLTALIEKVPPKRKRKSSGSSK